MDTAEIGVLNLFFLILLVLPILVVNRSLGIKQDKKILISILRMVVQLTLVGIYLQYIFDLNNIWLNIAYVLVMMCVASWSIIDSTPLKRRSAFPSILLSLIIPNLLMLLFFNSLVIHIDKLFDAKYMITIGGMIIGNGMSGNIVGLSTFYNNLLNNEEVYRYDIMLGASKMEALRPHFKEAVLVSVNPTIASMATIGLVSLPGMMTGQILGGSLPIDAIKYQIAIMIAIFVTKYFNIYLAIIMTTKQFFDVKHQLKRSCFKV